jgi:GT2 family glycosyltransferase
MSPHKYSVTFACYNALVYTQACVNSLIETGMPLERLVIVDNASRDGTREYLETIPMVKTISNSENMGCGVAWNQGATALQSEWTIIMNNDVLVSPHWIEQLIDTAEALNLKIISPALIEGVLDYDFKEFVKTASVNMKNVHRMGERHAVCMAVHQSVWESTGYFEPKPELLGFEDTLFFNEARKAGIPMGMTGAAWLHHFGSITQSLMKAERGLKEKEALGYRYNYRLLNQSWLTRKLSKWLLVRQRKAWCKDEVKRFGMSIHGLRKNGCFEWI